MVYVQIILRLALIEFMIIVTNSFLYYFLYKNNNNNLQMSIFEFHTRYFFMQ